MPTKRSKPSTPPTSAADARRSARRTPAKAAPAQAPSYLDIATRAYALFLERGGAHGSDQEDWLRAEQELQPR